VKVIILCASGGIALIFFIIALCFKMSVVNKRDRCSEMIKGRVAGYSKAAYCDDYVRLPVVEYTVDDVTYKITGPQYNFSSSTISTPFVKETDCEYTEDIYSQVFRMKIRMNSFGGVIHNPMTKLFPVGSEVEVYYDPMKPKRAYVLRLLEHKFVIKLFSWLGMAFTAIALFGYFI